MRSTTHSRCLPVVAVLLGLTAFGCEPDGDPSKKTATSNGGKAPPTKKVEIGKNVFLEILANKKRRVLVNAQVCLRMGSLEQLLCLKGTKEHEAILAADADARKIHTALVLAGAETPGHPIKFSPDGKEAIAPKGTTIKIYLQYKEKGKTVTVPAQKWIRNAKTEKELHTDWVFAGSVLFKNDSDPKAEPFYGASQGDVICLANFETAMLDLPLISSKDNDELNFNAWTARIPPIETAVTVILEPVLKAKKK